MQSLTGEIHGVVEGGLLLVLVVVVEVAVLVVVGVVVVGVVVSGIGAQC